VQRDLLGGKRAPDRAPMPLSPPPASKAGLLQKVERADEDRVGDEQQLDGERAEDDEDDSLSSCMGGIILPVAARSCAFGNRKAPTYLFLALLVLHCYLPPS